MAQDIEAVAQPADVVMVTLSFEILLAAIVESVPALVAEVAISITIMVAANMTTAWVAIIVPADRIKNMTKIIVMIQTSLSEFFRLITNTQQPWETFVTQTPSVMKFSMRRFKA